jgi:hypothetical protein
VRPAGPGAARPRRRRAGCGPIRWEILPLAERFVTAAEWHGLGEHGLKGAPKSALPLVFGMAMYEGDPATVKSVLAGAPLAGRLLMPVIGPRVYAKHAKRVHGTPTPPRIGTGR